MSLIKHLLGRKNYKQNVKKCLRVTNSDYTQITQASLLECKLREMVGTTTAVLDSLFQKNAISLAGQTLKDGRKICLITFSKIPSKDHSE